MNNYGVETEGRIVFSVSMEVYSEEAIVEIALYFMDKNIDFDEGESDGKTQWFIKKENAEQVKRFFDVVGLQYEMEQ